MAKKKASSRQTTRPPIVADSHKKTASPSTAKTEEGLSARWTFFTNHAHVLILLHANPEMVLRQVASTVGITERAVQRIVMDLEASGYIRREKVGRRNRYQVVTDIPLRHSIEAHRKIGDLLRLISGRL